MNIELGQLNIPKRKYFILGPRRAQSWLNGRVNLEGREHNDWHAMMNKILDIFAPIIWNLGKDNQILCRISRDSDTEGIVSNFQRKGIAFHKNTDYLWFEPKNKKELWRLLDFIWRMSYHDDDALYGTYSILILRKKSIPDVTSKAFTQIDTEKIIPKNVFLLFKELDACTEYFSFQAPRSNKEVLERVRKQLEEMSN